MDKVGEDGRGESVWLGFFLYNTLTRFAGLARAREDLPFAAHCESEAARLRSRLEESGWDGGWYRRAYFDDGSPWGPPRTRNARSTLSRKAGPCCRTPPGKTAPVLPCRPWMSG